MATDREMKLAELAIQATNALCQLAELRETQQINDAEFSQLKQALLKVAK